MSNLERKSSPTSWGARLSEDHKEVRRLICEQLDIPVDDFPDFHPGSFHMMSKGPDDYAKKFVAAVKADADRKRQRAEKTADYPDGRPMTRLQLKWYSEHGVEPPDGGRVYSYLPDPRAAKARYEGR